MSIKPIYANRLIKGTKHFEFRRSSISLDLTHMIVYASSPIKKILGIVEVNRVNVASPADTWQKTKQFAGIERKDFQEYFSDRDVAYSIEIEPDAIILLQKEINPKDVDPNFQVPQSFRYVDKAFLEKVLELGF